MGTTLDRVEHKLEVIRGLVYKAALEAETLSDQGLADDLHMLHADLVSRLLPEIRRGKSRSTLDTSST